MKDNFESSRENNKAISTRNFYNQYSNKALTMIVGKNQDQRIKDLEKKRAAILRLKLEFTLLNSF